MPTYIAFAAEGNTDMFESDIKYYRLLTAWNAMKERDFEFINAHERGAMLREGSNPETIKRTLRARLDKSKRMLLLVGNNTRLDDDFVPYEIEYAIDTCKLPVIVCYVNHDKRIVPGNNSVSDFELRKFVPKALLERVDREQVKTINIPFKEQIILRSIQDFSKQKLPTYAFGRYLDSVYDQLYKKGEI